MSDDLCPVCDGVGKLALRSRDLSFGGSREFEYRKCDDCEAIYQSPMPSPEEIVSFYPDEYAAHRPPKLKHPFPVDRAILKRYEGYNHLKTGAFLDFVAPFVYRLSKRRRIRRLHHVKYVEGGRALDIGCGSGSFLLQLQHLGWCAQGVEFDSRAVEICRRNGLDVFQGDLLNAVFPDASFDLITTDHVIEHLPDPNRVFKEMFRIMKPGGRLLIRTPNTKSLGRVWFKKYWFPEEVPRHLVLYNVDNLGILATRSGFTLEFVSVIPKTSWLLHSVDYLIGNKRKPSFKITWRSWLVSPYYPLSRLLGRGDEISAIYRKQGS